VERKQQTLLNVISTNQHQSLFNVYDAKKRQWVLMALAQFRVWYQRMNPNYHCTAATVLDPVVSINF
jgi:hypothetical protein